MATEFAKGFYNSPAWKRCRKGFIAWRRGIDGGLCQRCGARRGYIVHHKTELTPQNINDTAVALAWDNLEYLCKPCHEQEHDYCGRQTPALVQFDQRGDVTPPKKTAGFLAGTGGGSFKKYTGPARDPPPLKSLEKGG